LVTTVLWHLYHRAISAPSDVKEICRNIPINSCHNKGVLLGLFYIVEFFWGCCLVWFFQCNFFLLIYYLPV